MWVLRLFETLVASTIFWLVFFHLLSLKNIYLQSYESFWMPKLNVLVYVERNHYKYLNPEAYQTVLTIFNTNYLIQVENFSGLPSISDAKSKKRVKYLINRKNIIQQYLKVLKDRNYILVNLLFFKTRTSNHLLLPWERLTGFKNGGNWRFRCLLFNVGNHSSKEYNFIKNKRNSSRLPIS